MKVQRDLLERHPRRDGVNDTGNLTRVRDPDGVADRNFEGAHLDQRSRDVRDTRRDDVAFEGQPNAVDT